MITWDGAGKAIDLGGKVVDLLIRAEIHSFAMIGIGSALWFHGNHDQGGLVLGAGLTAFTGGKKS